MISFMNSRSFATVVGFLFLAFGTFGLLSAIGGTAMGKSQPSDLMVAVPVCAALVLVGVLALRATPWQELSSRQKKVRTHLITAAVVSTMAAGLASLTLVLLTPTSSGRTLDVLMHLTTIAAGAWVLFRQLGTGAKRQRKGGD